MPPCPAASLIPRAILQPWRDRSGKALSRNFHRLSPPTRLVVDASSRCVTAQGRTFNIYHINVLLRPATCPLILFLRREHFREVFRLGKSKTATFTIYHPDKRASTFVKTKNSQRAPSCNRNGVRPRLIAAADTADGLQAVFTVSAVGLQACLHRVYRATRQRTGQRTPSRRPAPGLV